MEDWEVLTTQEKISVFQTLIKGIKHQMFNIEAELEAEVILDSPNQLVIDNSAKILNDLQIKENFYRDQISILEASL